MKTKKTTIFWIIGIILVLVILFAYPRLKNSGTEFSANVPCLIPNLPLVQHIHPQLKIFSDGKQETVPAEIGINSSCEKALHTHDASGEIHVEAQDTKQYTFGDFMAVWGKSLDRPGYTYEFTADGQKIENPLSLLLKDKQEIIVKYKKVEQTNN